MTDNVNHPAHYKFPNGAEVIDITENLSFNLGNVVKYVTRAGRKTSDPVEDLRKAQFYLDRELTRLLFTPDPEPTRPRVFYTINDVPTGVKVTDRDGDYYLKDIWGDWQLSWDGIDWEPSQINADEYAPFTEVL